MKKQIQIIGIGPRKVGISKSKQAYDFTEVSILFDDAKFQGQKAETIAIEQEILAEHPLKPGEVYEAELYTMNFKTRLACIYG